MYERVEDISLSVCLSALSVLSVSHSITPAASILAFPRLALPVCLHVKQLPSSSYIGGIE